MAVRDNSPIEIFSTHGIYPRTRTIYMGDYFGCIEETLASEVLKAIHVLESYNGEDINIIMNSCGGVEYDMFAIYDTIKTSPCKFTIRATGACMSAATIILQAADWRIVSPHTTFMIHDGTDGYEGHTRDFEAWAEWSKEWVRPAMYKIYFDQMKKKNKKLRIADMPKVCCFDKIMTANEAVKLGLADVVA